MLAQDRVGSDAQAEAVTVVLRQRDLLMRRMPGLAKQHQSPPREPCLSADDVQKLTAAEMTSMALLLSLASTKALLHLLGFGFGLEKLKPFGVTAELLGVLVDLTKAAEGIIQVRNKPSRIDQLKPILDEALSTGTIVPASLPSFLGKLQYADAQLFGRAGRLALADLRKLGHFSRVPASLDASCRTALEILKERLLFGKPRTLTASWREPPFLLFTDGALEQSASLGCEASIGAVLFPPGHGRAQVFGCAVPEPVLAHWRAAGSHHVIGIVELYAIVVALRHWRRLLRGRRTIVFVDNWSALDVMVRGNGDVATWRELLLTLENPEENVVSCLWIARVPSKSNISDGPSRACLDELTPFKPEIVGIPTVWRRWSPERRPSRLSCDVILEILFVTGTGVSRLQRFGYVAGRGRHSGPFGGGQHSHNSHIRLIPWHAIDFVEAERALQAPGHELMDGGPLRSTSSREASASGLSGLKASGIFSLIDPRAEQVSASVRLDGQRVDFQLHAVRLAVTPPDRPAMSEEVEPGKQHPNQSSLSDRTALQDAPRLPTFFWHFAAAAMPKAAAHVKRGRSSEHVALKLRHRLHSDVVRAWARKGGATDSAPKKKKKSKKNKKQSKSPAPGFDLTTKPGEEKNHVFSFMQRLKHASHGNNSAHQLGICYYTAEVKEGHVCSHQSTLVVSAEDACGAPYAWSGQEFRGEVARKKAQAENAAARAFLNDDAVQRTAANMDPAYAYKLSPCQKRRLGPTRQSEPLCNGWKSHHLIIIISMLNKTLMMRTVVPGASLHRNSLLDLQLKDASSCGSAVSCATRENGGKSREMQFLPRARDAGHSSPTYRGSFAHATSWRCSRLKETKLRGFRVLRLVQLWVDRGILSAQEAEEVKAITPLDGQWWLMVSISACWYELAIELWPTLDLFVAERFGNCLQLPARRGSLSFVGFELDVGGRGQITLWCSTASVVLRDKIVVPFADELLREAKLVPGHPRVPHRARSFCGSARADSRGNLWRIMTMVVSVLVLMLSKFDLEQRRASRRCLWHAAAASVYHFAAAPEICHQRQLVPPLPWCHYIIPVAPQQDYQAVLCTNCGSLCGADYHFCPFCGTSICWVVAVYFQPEWQMPEQPQMTESVAPVERPAEAVWCLDCAWQEHISAMDLEEVALKPGISVEPVAGGGGAAASSSVRVQAVEAENWAESEQLLNERPKEGDVNVRTADWNYSLRVYLSPAAGA
eukprot:s3279_g2.t11